MPRPTRSALASVLLLSVAPAAAQTCGPQWLPGDGYPGIEGTVHAITTWDPDGPGPATPLWTFGGEFTLAGNIAARRIAMYDPASNEWSTIPLGTGTTPVYALAAMPNGDLVAGGTFYVAAGIPVPLAYIARWDGSAWRPLETGMAGGFPYVLALAVLPDGDLVAGGTFITAGGVTVNRIARWDGVAWWPLGGGVDGQVSAVIALPNGDVIAGGWFNAAGTAQATRIARWDGTTWSPLGTGLNNGVMALARAPNGDIIVGGRFTSIVGGQSVNRVARWTGSSWLPFGLGSGSDVNALTVMPNGEVVAGGAFNAPAGQPPQFIARWDGSTWLPLGSGTDSAIRALCPVGGSLLAGGEFLTAGGVAADGAARWDGVAWSSISPGMDAPVEDMTTIPGGQVLAAGQFKSIGGVPARFIAQWNGAHWSSVGAGVNGRVRTLAVTSNGVVAGGDFTAAGGFAANRVARWNGSWWSTLGGGVLGGSHVRLVGASLRSDAAVVAGDFTVAGGFLINNGLAFWDGSSWSPLNGSPAGGGMKALAILPSGEPVAANGSTIYRWNGSAWTTLVNMGSTVSVLRELDGGDLIAGGAFTISSGAPSNYMARFDGSNWSPFPVGPPVPASVSELAIAADAHLAVASSGAVYRWDGAEWSGGPAVDGQVLGLAMLGGEVIAGGSFTEAAGLTSRYTARWTATNIPWIAVHPHAAPALAGASVMFSCTPASRYLNLTAEWELETAPASGSYVPLSQGFIPSAPPAVATITQPVGGATPGPTRLTISGLSAALNNRRVRVRIANTCGAVTSNPALVTITGCYADCNADGALTAADFGCFQTRFAAADPYADCNASGALTVQDFGCFQTAFAAGCP